MLSCLVLIRACLSSWSFLSFVQGLTKDDAILVGDSPQSHGKDSPCCLELDNIITIKGSPLKVLQADKYPYVRPLQLDSLLLILLEDVGVSHGT